MTPLEGPRWHTWIDDGEGRHRSHKSLRDAEAHARRVARDGKVVEITDDNHRTLAYVRVDGLGRVWTDVRATEVL